jgi:hypothetical protein
LKALNPKQPPMNADERREDLDRITEKIIGCDSNGLNASESGRRMI